MYMLRTNLKPAACFKAVQTVLKRSGPVLKPSGCRQCQLYIFSCCNSTVHTYVWFGWVRVQIHQYYKSDIINIIDINKGVHICSVVLSSSFCEVFWLSRWLCWWDQPRVGSSLYMVAVWALWPLYMGCYSIHMYVYMRLTNNRKMDGWMAVFKVIKVYNSVA